MALPANPPIGGPLDKPIRPDTTSSDYDFMKPYWDKVDTFKGGEEAMKAAGQTYLPRFPNEDINDYRYRLKTAKFTNIYSDIIYHLAAKPFSQEITLEEDADQQLQDLCLNIDGKGSDLNGFASEIFYDGVDRAIDWLFVDMPKAQPRADGRPLSRADEQEQGLRPYWVHIPAPAMIAVHSQFIGGEEVFFHVRWVERSVELAGYEEVNVDRIREYNREPQTNIEGVVTGYGPPTFKVWQRETIGRRARSQAWKIVAEGSLQGMPIIPLVPFITGKRIGRSWRFVPAMLGAADLQVQLYQAETALRNIKDFTAFPMVTGNGVQPERQGGVIVPVKVGPRAVLYAPPQLGQSGSGTAGEWKFMEPQATSLKFLSEEVDKMEKQIRELGRQPLTAESGNLTVVTTAFAAQKGNSAIQAWALGLKASLERALKLTCMWLKLEQDPKVLWNLEDLNLDTSTDKGPEFLKAMRDKGDLSRETMWAEAQRRNFLSSDFDAKKEAELLEQEKEKALEEQKKLHDATTADIIPGDLKTGTPPRSLPPPLDPNKRPPASK